MSYTTFALGDKEGLQFIYLFILILFIYFLRFGRQGIHGHWDTYIHSIGERNNESIANLEDLLGDTTLEIRGHWDCMEFDFLES